MARAMRHGRRWAGGSGGGTERSFSQLLSPALLRLAYQLPPKKAEPPSVEERVAANRLPPDLIVEIRARHEFLCERVTDLALEYGLHHSRAVQICDYTNYGNIYPAVEDAAPALERMIQMRSLDSGAEAVCPCGREYKYVTLRQVKNKWPHCSCKKPMRVKSEKSKSRA